MESQPAKFHVSTHWRKILEHSFVYNLWQLFIGGEAVHRAFIDVYCIDFAKKKYGDRGHFFCARVSDASIATGSFDIVLALGILHHLSEHESLKLIESAWNSLKPGGFLFSADPVWTNTQSRLEKFLMSKDRGQNIRTEEEYKKLIRTRFVNIESQVVSGLLNIPWTANLIKAWKN